MIDSIFYPRLRASLYLAVLATCSLALAEDVKIERLFADSHYTVPAGGNLEITHKMLLEKVQGGEGDVMISRIVLAPGRNGTIRMETGTFVYTPNKEFYGTGLLQFAAQDDKGILTGKVFVAVVDEEKQSK